MKIRLSLEMFNPNYYLDIDPIYGGTYPIPVTDKFIYIFEADTLTEAKDKIVDMLVEFDKKYSGIITSKSTVVFQADHDQHMFNWRQRYLLRDGYLDEKTKERLYGK